MVIREALSVLNTFVKLVDAFVPLWTKDGHEQDLEIWMLGNGKRSKLRKEMLASVKLLDDEMKRILSDSELSRDNLDVVLRYIEMRYIEMRYVEEQAFAPA